MSDGIEPDVMVVLSRALKPFTDALLLAAREIGDALNGIYGADGVARMGRKHVNRMRYLRRYKRRGERMKKK